MNNQDPPDVWMQAALELARTVEGRTSPNPPVGAVVVRAGRMVGQGATQPPGGPHAEVVALRQAGAQAEGATLYSSLEPCTFYGRTPPCTEAIRAAGIARVVYAVQDPNPRIGAGAAAVLEPYGVAVEQDRRASALAEQLYAPFRRWVLSGRPYVTVKYAMTLDGKIATRSGDARWISGPESRAYVHELRDRCDAILVGIGTVELDDPQLTVRLEGAELQAERPPHQPLRIVLDSQGRMDPNARMLWDGMPGSTLVATTQASGHGWRQALAARGAEVVELPADEQGRVALPELLDELARRGVLSLLVEGGGEVIASFISARLVDQLLAFIAPKIVGGLGAPTPAGGEGQELMRDAHQLEIVALRRLGDDTLIVCQPAWYNTGTVSTGRG